MPYLAGKTPLDTRGALGHALFVRDGSRYQLRDAACVVRWCPIGDDKHVPSALGERDERGGGEVEGMRSYPMRTTAAAKTGV